MTRCETMGRAAAALLLLIAPWVGPVDAYAQSWPERPVRLVVPYSPGGGTDILGRQLAPRISELLGRQVIIDNRPGGNANIGALAVGNSPADGYTLLLGDTALAVNPTILADQPNPMKQLDPISLVARAQLILIVHQSLGVTSVGELVRLAKQTPGKLTYASAGGANPATLAPEVFKRTEGVDILAVPYKGGGPALIDLVGGRISMLFTGVSSAKPHIDDGRVRALAVTMKNRAPTLPGVPTFAEAGHPLTDLDDGSWWGILGPMNIPAEVKERIDSTLRQVIASAELQKALAALNIHPSYSDARLFGQLIQSETDKWGRFIRSGSLPRN